MDLDMTVYDVLEGKKGALDYEKNHFNIIEKYEIHPWLKSKIWNFFRVGFFLKKTQVWCFMMF